MRASPTVIDIMIDPSAGTESGNLNAMNTPQVVLAADAEDARARM